MAVDYEELNRRFAEGQLARDQNPDDSFTLPGDGGYAPAPAPAPTLYAGERAGQTYPPDETWDPSVNVSADDIAYSNSLDVKNRTVFDTRKPDWSVYDPPSPPQNEMEATTPRVFTPEDALDSANYDTEHGAPGRIDAGRQIESVGQALGREAQPIRPLPSYPDDPHVQWSQERKPADRRDFMSGTETADAPPDDAPKREYIDPAQWGIPERQYQRPEYIDPQHYGIPERPPSPAGTDAEIKGAARRVRTVGAGMDGLRPTGPRTGEEEIPPVVPYQKPRLIEEEDQGGVQLGEPKGRGFLPGTPEYTAQPRPPAPPTQAQRLQQEYGLTDPRPHGELAVSDVPFDPEQATAQQLGEYPLDPRGATAPRPALDPSVAPIASSEFARDVTRKAVGEGLGVADVQQLPAEAIDALIDLAWDASPETRAAMAATGTRLDPLHQGTYNDVAESLLNPKKREAGRAFVGLVAQAVLQTKGVSALRDAGTAGRLIAEVVDPLGAHLPGPVVRTGIGAAAGAGIGYSQGDTGNELAAGAVLGGAVAAAAPHLAGAATAPVAKALDILKAAGAPVKGAVTEAAGVVERGAARVADALPDIGGGPVREARAGGVLPRPAEIPRFGHAGDVSPEAAARLGQESARNAETPVARAAVAAEAERVLGLDPGRLKAWQDAAAAPSATVERAVQSEGLRRAAYADQEAAVTAYQKLLDAQQRAAAGPNAIGAGDELAVAQAAFDAAGAAARLSSKASSAEGTATARALGQRQNRIVAGRSYQIAERAKLVGSAAQDAADLLERTNGEITPDVVRRMERAAAVLDGNADVLDAGANGVHAALDAVPTAGGAGVERAQATADRLGAVVASPRAAGSFTDFVSQLDQISAPVATAARQAADAGMAEAEVQRTVENALRGATAGALGQTVDDRANERETDPAALIKAAVLGAIGGVVFSKIRKGNVPLGLGVEKAGGDAAHLLPSERQAVIDEAAAAQRGRPRVTGVDPDAALKAQMAGDQTVVDETKALDAARVRGVADQIREVLATPKAPDAAERMAQLRSDLAEIGQAGASRASEIRQRLVTQGLMKAGIDAKDDQAFSAIVTALGRVDPDKPEQMAALVRSLGKNRFIDRLLEYQYVNMLSSPMTNMVNISSNSMQLAGRLLLQNPMEFALSLGEQGGVRSAFSGAARGFREGLGEAGQILRTGISQADTNAAVELGDFGRLNREFLTEKYGAVGAVLHTLSTRPLEAADALLGHMAYASTVDQHADRVAAQLLRSGNEAVKGLSQEQVKQQVLANIWDHPEIIEKAGRIKDYTLLRERPMIGDDRGSAVNRMLSALGSSRVPREGAGAAEQVSAAVMNQALPFFSVPFNFAKQGVERTVGAPIDMVRGAAGVARHGTGDEESVARLAKGTIGLTSLGLAAVLAGGDLLTGDGPSDPARRKVWSQTHVPRSVWTPGGWVTYDGTPLAIPFSAVAGVVEGWGAGGESGDKKGESTLGRSIRAGAGAARGAAKGFASQSFVKQIGDSLGAVSGDGYFSPQNIAMLGGNVEGRFFPAAGLLNFGAKVTDLMERDTGRAVSMDEVPGQALVSSAVRLPGLREQQPERLDLYGQGVRNQQAGPLGLVPYRRGHAPLEGDPNVAAMERAGVGISPVPSEAALTYKGREAGKLPLSPSERHTFEQYRGVALKRMLDTMAPGQTLSGDVYQKIMDAAREEAKGRILGEVGGEEINRRLRVPAAAGR